MVLEGGTLDTCGAPGRCSGLVAAIVAFALGGTVAAETWRGLTVAPENRCSPCDRTRDCGRLTIARIDGREIETLSFDR